VNCIRSVAGLQGLALSLLLALLAPHAGAQAPAAGAQAPAADQPPPLRFTVSAFRVEGDNPLDAARTEQILAPFRGEYAGVEGLYEAASTLEQAFAEAGHSFRRVVLPAQTLQAGTVVLEVVAFKLGEITVKGNQHFSRENILRSMPGLVSGETPQTQLLSQQRHSANLHPSKQIQLRLKESRTQLAIDAELEVVDSDPHDLFVGLNNTGNQATGDFRILTGFQHSNLSGRDDQFTVSTTISPTKIDKVEQLGASYALPLYSLGGRLNAYIATSNVDSGTVQGVFGASDVTGAGRFLGVSYTHFLPRMGAYTHQLTAGIDDKRFRNDISNAGQPSGVNVRSRPLSIGYSASYEHARGVTGLYASYVRNIPRGPLNDKRNYGNPAGRPAPGNPLGGFSREGSDPVWDALRFGASADVRVFDNWLLRWRGDGQLTTEPLIPGEQFGAGGARSVRGYEEREVAGDTGWFTSLEAWSPELYPGLRAIGFFDIAHVRNKNIRVTETKKFTETLSGVGVGVRWYWRTNLSLEADVARPLSDAGITRDGDYRVHFSTFYRF